MADIALNTIGGSQRREPVSLRWRIVLILSAVVLAIFVAGAAIVYGEARDDRHAIEHQAVSAAIATSTAFDREVAATAYLLKGLSRSPALKVGDFRAFYDQLVDTPRPEGSWLVLWSLDRQVLNTARPYGTRLPTFAEAGVQEGSINRIRDRGTSISDRVIGPVVQHPTVAVHLRLDGPDGQMNGLLTSVLPETRLQELARENPLPAGWVTIVLDRQLAPVSWSEAGSDGTVGRVASAMTSLASSWTAGHFNLQVGQQEHLVGVQRSPVTGYTTVTVVPRALADASVNAALWKIASAGIGLALAGILAGLMVFRQVGPVELSAATTARRLRLAEARYKSLWSDTPESLFVVTVTECGRFVFEGLNPAHERATGLRFEDIAGNEPEECLPPISAAAVLARYRYCVATGRPEIYDEVLDFPSGRRIWQTSLSPVHDPDTGRIFLLVGTARDVTDDREARARIEESRKLLQATLDALSAHIAILDGTGTIIAVNRAWHRFAEEGGYDVSDHGIGRNYIEVCRDGAPDLAHELEKVLGGERETFKSSYRCGERFFQMSVARFRYAGTAHVVVAHEDITDLRSAQQDVREIAERLLSLQEEERQRIAGDLHDSTAQHIVAAGLGLMNVSAVAAATPEVEEAIGTVRTSLDEAHREIRTLSYLLYPPDLGRHGLAGTLRHFVEGFSRRTGLRSRASVSPGVDDLTVDLQRSVLRVVQEALVNVHRHARATRVTVEVKLDDSHLHLRIRDDGKGLRTGQAGEASPLLGVGIPGMQARIRQFGGVLEIDSAGRGTTVRATIPLGA